MKGTQARFILLLSIMSLHQAFAQPEYQPPLTEHGQPDLQGVWNNSSRTPLQRPAALGTKRFYTEQEAADLHSQAQQEDQQKAAPIDPNRAPPEAGGAIMFQADENFANTRIDLVRINGEYRTSLVVQPENGRFPYVENVRQKDVFGQWVASGRGAVDGPEVRSQMERCLHVGAQMPPMMAWTYNANYQIVQNRDYVVINSEMIHDARIIRLGGEHQRAVPHKWFGDSVGRWEGNTLVVESINFHPQQSNFFILSSDQLRVTEWFTPVSENEILYRYEMVDPVIFSEPVMVEMMMNRKADGEAIYEFACHEGNYSLPSILAGARREEIEAELGL